MPSLIIQTLPSRVRKNKWYLELHTDLKKDKLIIAITCWTRLGISIWSSLSLDCFSIWLQHNDRWTFLNSNNYWKVDRCDNSQLRGSRVFLLNIPQARLHYWIIFIALSSFCWGMRLLFFLNITQIKLAENRYTGYLTPADSVQFYRGWAVKQDITGDLIQKGIMNFENHLALFWFITKDEKYMKVPLQNNRTSTGGIWRSRVYEKTIIFFQNFPSLMRWLSCWYKHTALLISTVSLICRVLFFIILLRKWEPISVQLLQWRENLCAWCRWLGWMHPQ